MIQRKNCIGYRQSYSIAFQQQHYEPDRVISIQELGKRDTYNIKTHNRLISLTLTTT